MRGPMAFMATDVSDGARRWSIGQIDFATILVRGVVGAAVPAILATLVAGCGKGAPAPATPSDDTATRTADGSSREALPKPALAELLVADLTPEALRDKALQARIDPILQGAFFDATTAFARVPDTEARGCRARVSIGYALIQNGKPVPTAEAGVARAVLESELDCPDPTDPTYPTKLEGFRVTVTDERPFGGTHGGTGAERLLEAITQAVTDNAGRLFGQVITRHASDADILANLAAKPDGAHADHAGHPGILAESASEAGERHLAAAVPDLVRLTTHANLQVATRAGAALGLLKTTDPDALRALVRMTEGPTTERHRVAIMALSDVGTPEARRYLETLAVSHPAPELRELARERLRALAP